MNLKKLVKIAASNPEAREALIIVAKALEKRAASSNATTKFDETVPVMQQPPQQKQVSGTGMSAVGTAQPQGDPNVPPQMVDQAPPAGAMPPMGGGAPGDQIAAEPQAQAGPAQQGVAAAQEFLAPILEAAMQGDPNAQAIIAQAAGNIAMGVAAATGAPAPDMAGGAPAGPVGPDGMPVAPASPEEQVANQIVPEAKPEAPASQPGEGEPPVKEESGKDTGKKEDKDKAKQGTKSEDDKEFKKMSSMKLSTFKTLLDLARAGKI